ncbi:MAG: primosomal protein N' [Rikenellaceae bacterium]
MAKYADIVLPLAIPPLTYEVDEGMELREGEAVAVPMGQAVATFYTGVVWRLHDERPDYSVVRKVAKRLYDRVLLSAEQRKFWEWMADYYLCNIGDVMRVALPAMVKPSGIDEQAIVIKEKRALKKGRAKVESEEELFELPQLTPHQMEALEAIERGHDEKLCALLHGVTGSGKTEVYIHLIAKKLSEGRDVLMLVPEIALTTQLIDRMKRIFGVGVTAYHSKLPPRRRTDSFMSLTLNHEGGNFIIGARSAIFLPLNKLGLIIIDEEHDPSYKQIEPSPRYNARDCSHILASQFGAKVVMGSATPSLESWTNAYTGKFASAKLTERYGDAEMPNIIISDSQRAGKRRERRGHFNLDLITKIEERLQRGEQTMLFQNRRGFAPYVECAECGWVARCPSCNVSLTMHKAGQRLICHYCDHTIPLPKRCPSCTVGEPIPMGFGTEKIEEQIAEFLPTARVVRMDRDTATSQSAFERIVGSFARHESDIMVGTQMIAKGFDFSDVTLVGILNADNMLLNPDFRAEERAFSLMLQVAGRAGRRKGADADVVIQTSQPTHRVLKFVADNDYETMARTLLQEREAFFYPPYSRLTMITLRHRDVSRLHSGANALSQLLRERFAWRVKGPVPPPVDRLHGEWIVGFMLKIESGASAKKARDILRIIISEWQQNREFRSIKIICNVDPQ